jgi:hypothetical protein
MKYQYFIASRWRNKDAVLDLTRKLEARGRTVYNFIEADGRDYELKNKDQSHDPEKFMKDFESISNWQESKAVKEIFDIDMNALKDSETIIVLLPAGKSAHIEAGVSFGMGKKTILIGEQKETESLYLIFDEMYPTVEEFLNSI